MFRSVLFRYVDGMCRTLTLVYISQPMVKLVSLYVILLKVTVSKNLTMDGSKGGLTVLKVFCIGATITARLSFLSAFQGCFLDTG